MRRRISKLPKFAVYDFTDIFGKKVFHKNTRRYIVDKIWVYSEPLSEDYQS